jgi:hypothetical protein
MSINLKEKNENRTMNMKKIISKPLSLICNIGCFFLWIGCNAREGGIILWNSGIIGKIIISTLFTLAALDVVLFFLYIFPTCYVLILFS